MSVDDWQRLVIDNDQRQRTRRRRLVDGRDRRHHVTGVTHLVGAQRRLVLDDNAVAVLPLDVAAP